MAEAPPDKPPKTVPYDRFSILEEAKKKWGSWGKSESVAAEEEHGGYAVEEFVDAVPDDYTCSVCLYVLRDPVLTNCCGTLFCETCIQRVKKSRMPSCPHCREQFDFMRDKRVQRKVLELKVRCSHSSQGCQWTGSLRDREYHSTEQCEFDFMKCSKCDRNVLRYELQGHLENDCPKRDHQCEYCGWKGCYVDVTTAHYQICDKYPCLCPNRCDVGIIERSQLGDHIANSCPWQRVYCEFSEMGCTYQVPRKDLARHIEEGVYFHLGLVGRGMSDVQKTHERLSAEVKQRESRLQTLHIEVKALKQAVPRSPFMVSMNNFKSNKRDKVVWVSPSFYTHFEGYKLCIKVYPAGEPKNGFVSVYCVMQRGEYDDYLSWPADITITLQLLNTKSPPGAQTGHWEYTSTFRFQRCTVGTDEGHTHGWPEFIHHSELENPKNPEYAYLDRHILNFQITAQVSSSVDSFPWS